MGEKDADLDRRRNEMTIKESIQTETRRILLGNLDFPECDINEILLIAEEMSCSDFWDYILENWGPIYIDVLVN